MRGEDTYITSIRSPENGSPPHARGRLDDPEGVYGSREDHPRMRGEDEFEHSLLERVAGSPPHARGRQARPSTPCSPSWITPACAGKTSRPSLPASKAQDHPRMRGEDVNVEFACRIVDGSPPHARGRPRP